MDERTNITSSGDSGSAGDDDSGVTVERLGIDPAIEFGTPPRTIIFDGDDGNIDGSDGGSDGGEPGNRGGADSDDEYQRNADGSVKRNRDGSPRRKRRRRGSGTSFVGGSKTSAKGAVNLNGVEAILLSLHEMAAAATRTPELRLDNDEAAGMAKAVAEVARHYPTHVDPKLLAWINLIMALGVVYAPRAYLIRERIKAERASPVANNPSTVPTSIDIPISPPNPNGEQKQSPRPQNASDVAFGHVPGAVMAGLEG